MYVAEDRLNEFVSALVKHKLRVQLPSYNLVFYNNGKLLKSTMSVPMESNYYDDGDREDSISTITENTIIQTEPSTDNTEAIDKPIDNINDKIAEADKITTNSNSQYISNTSSVIESESSIVFNSSTTAHLATTNTLFIVNNAYPGNYRSSISYLSYS